VAGVAEAHGGSAAVTDRPDGASGARFELRLPMASPAGGTRRQ
jgi:signal transduction histidine kinase